MSIRLYLVRHGLAAAGCGEDPDPGLDEVGRSQAVRLAAELGTLGPMPIVSSPMRRAQETAAPLAERWAVEPTVDEGVGEIPSPTADLAERSAWLREAMRGRWADLGPGVIEWRSRLLTTVQAVPTDTVVFTHFVAINTVVAAVSDDPALIVFAPAYASPTVVDVDDGKLSLVALGRQADSSAVR